MAEYIVNNGMKVTEEALEETYRLHNFAFNERDYNAWKQSKIEQGVIKIAEETKTVTHYDLFEALDEVNKRFRYAQLHNTAGTFDETVIIGVSWSAIGATTPEEAEQFAEEVKRASQAAKDFKYNGYKIIYR